MYTYVRTPARTSAGGMLPQSACVRTCLRAGIVRSSIVHVVLGCLKTSRNFCNTYEIPIVTLSRLAKFPFAPPLPFLPYFSAREKYSDAIARCLLPNGGRTEDRIRFTSRKNPMSPLLLLYRETACLFVALPSSRRKESCFPCPACTHFAG